MQRPPEGVKMVIEAVCIMRAVKPKKIPGEKPGQKIDDYWEPGKSLLQDPPKFLESLFKYDRDNITDDVIKRIQPYIDDDNFLPAAIQKVSKACTSICMWVRAMHKYHFVAKGVAPKREKLRIATEELAETQRILGEAKQRLADVEEGIATLQAKYDDCVRKKDELETKCKECEGRLVRADKLIGGLADEKERWKESVEKLEIIINNYVGDVLISSAYIAYLGPFTGEYRGLMQSEWVEKLSKFKVPQTDDPTLINTLSDPVKIRSWQICGLPKDNLSVENGVIVQYSRRWPLFIDPQGQANRWVKNMERESGLDVIKLSDKDFLRSLENAVRFGKPCLLENIGVELDPALEPILLKQTFKQQGSTVIKLGDAVIPYHDDFKFYITTKLPNPHYTPEVSTKVTLVNFTLSPSGLEDQMLGIVVAEERPDLEEAKNQLIVSNAKMKQELKEIEDRILYRLSASEGSPVDDLDLIQTLEASKIKSMEIKAKVLVAEQTEKDIDQTRSQYIPVAINTQIMFFCVAAMANIDPMYQYSLEWFVGIFLGGIAQAERADNLPQRLLYSFLVCIRIKQHEGKIDMDEWRYLLAGGTSKPEEVPNPSPDWISERSWNDIQTLSVLPTFSTFALEFKDHLDDFKKLFDSPEPHREPLPGKWETDLIPFQKILILKCLRLDRVTNMMQDYVAGNLGQRFIEPQVRTEPYPTIQTRLLSLCLFHGVLLERRKYGALGFNIPYEFTDGDLRICISQLKMFLMEYSDIPYKVLVYTAGHINYGGRVTDDWDRRCLMNILGDFYKPTIIDDDYKYSQSGIYRQISSSMDHKGYIAYMRSLPINDTPEIFGLHENANITFAQNETLNMLSSLMALQPKSASGGGKSREEIMEETAKTILGQVPKPIDVEPVMEKYPVMYEQSMNTVLVQEVIRYNRLLSTIHKSLQDLLKALKGLVVMSQELENMANSLFTNSVPGMWAGKAYPSLKPLASWVLDLVTRMHFIQGWIDDGIPSVYWISGFFFPQAFLTGTLQNYARSNVISIDTISFGFKVMTESLSEVKKGPENGCYIYGLFLEGARWDATRNQLWDSKPKELYTEVPLIWLQPMSNRKAPLTGIYDCPVYKTLTRAGTLSTTGHSTNFVFSMEIPTEMEQKHWIKQGVAMLCALNY
ncbi:hypothetical protein ScPMuIL_011981 [Solemya velum]